MAANADWVIDADTRNIGTGAGGLMQVGQGNESNPARFPTPAQSGITGATLETYWAGALSTWGVTLVQRTHSVETLPYNGAITYGNSGNTQDLSNYRVFVIVEPNILYTAAEKTALVNFVADGGALVIVGNHGGSDRNSDGSDPPDVLNDLFTNNGVASNPFGISLNGNSVSVTSSQVNNTGTDPIINGPGGTVGSVDLAVGSTLTISTAANSTVRSAAWTSATHTNTNVIAAYARYGAGRVFVVGDSSIPDDGTGDPNDSLFDGWNTVDNGVLLTNASEWAALAGQTRWNLNGNGTWSTSANWTDGSPNRAGFIAIFGSAINAPRTVTIDGSRTVGAMVFDNANRYTLDGTGSITLDNAYRAPSISVVSGSHTTATPVVLTDNTTITVTPSNATLTISGALSAGTYGITKSGAGTVELKSLSAGSLIVSAGAVKQLPDGTTAGTSNLKSLTIAGTTNAWTSRVDLSDNSLVLDYSGATPRATIENQLKTGFAGGSWNGNGISSATAAGQSGAPNKTGLGIVEATDLFTVFPATFRGQTVDANSVLIRYTAMGDANLDGTVNSGDFNLLASNFGLGGARWAKGDFNFDSVVNSSDFNTLASNFGFTLPSSPGADVPEPGAFLLMGTSLVLLLKSTGGRVRRPPVDR